MILRVYGKLQEDESLSIKIQDEVKILDYSSSVVTFNIEEKKKYYIDIEQEITKSNMTPVCILLYLLTVVIQGVFNILLLNTDSTWEKNIKAYCLKAKLLVDIQEDTEIHLTYVNAKYNEGRQLWELPIFNVEPKVSADVSFLANPLEFRNQYINYIKRAVSVASVLEILFALLLYIATVNTITSMIIFISILLLGVLVLVGSLLIFQYKKYQRLYKYFLNQKEKI